MNQAEKALGELRAMDELSSMDSPMHRLPSTAKLVTTLVYLFVVVSFHKYDLFHLIWMLLFPLIGYQFAYIPVRTCFYKLRIALPLVCAVGLFNPFFDKQILLTIGSLPISGGVISMLTLMSKGVLCLMASFLLIATTPIEKLCMAFRRLYFPRFFTSLLLLTYRYISVLLEEVSIMTDAYHLRSPRQKGLHYSAWGSFVGQLIFRSMDRAEGLYQSMLLRGFNGDLPVTEPKTSVWITWLFSLAGIALILLVRFHPFW